MRKKLIFLLTIAAGLSGCESNRIFYWGSYEQMVYQNYAMPGAVSSSAQVQQLQNEIAQANQKGLYIAPGLYAYLGYLAVNAGQKSLALQAFQEEKKLFPESTRLMDDLISKLNTQKKSKEPVGAAVKTFDQSTVPPEGNL